MSRNFELLAQVERVLGSPVADVRADDIALEHPGASAAVIQDADGIGREEMRRLVQQVFLSANGSAPHAVVFCGIDDGKGSGVTCALTGRVLSAQTSRPVCIVDASRHSRSAAVNFLPGVSLRDQCQKIAENLWLAPAAALLANGDSASINDLRARFEALRREFDYVLVDAPPAAASSQTTLLSQVADGVVLVLEAHATRRIAARKTKEALESSNVRVLGTVLNNRTFPVPEKLYRRL